MKKVRDIMTSNVAALAPSNTIVEVAQQMRMLDVGSIPIVQNERLIGVITDRDIVLRVVSDGLDPHQERAEMHMSRDPVTISPDATADEANQAMSRAQIRRLPVVEGGRLVGYLALGDLALQGRDRRVGETLEQISEPGDSRKG
jgi:CBS domain-containing protein